MLRGVNWFDGFTQWILNAWVGDMYKAFVAMWHAQKRFCRKQETEHPRRWSNMSMQFFCLSYSIKRNDFPVGCWIFLASHSLKTTKPTCSFWSTCHPLSSILARCSNLTSKLLQNGSIFESKWEKLAPAACCEERRCGWCHLLGWQFQSVK